MSSTDQDIEDISDSGSSKLATPEHLPKDAPNETQIEKRETPKESTEQELIRIFKPVLFDLEQTVQGVASSQVLLRQELDQVLAALKELRDKTEDDSMAVILEEKSKKLISLKRRLTLIHTIIQTCNERARKLISNHKIQQKRDQ